MLTLTIKEAVLSDYRIAPGYVYVVRDNETIFYVGLSKDPAFRLCQHLGIADGWSKYTLSPEKLIEVMECGRGEIIPLARRYSSPVGAAILDNAPESLSWSFDIYEQKDAIAVIERTELPQAFPRLIEIMQVDWYEQRSLVENALIEQLKPYLNVMESRHTRDLPRRYRRYQHVMPGESSSLALDL